MQKQNWEKQCLDKFQAAVEVNSHQVFRGQGLDNRLSTDGKTYFQFGDLRVDTGSRYVVIEAESAGGITNLVKYWYCFEKRFIEKPLVLLHIFRQVSKSDYGSHLGLWRFTWEKMRGAIGDRMDANIYTYRDLADLDPIVLEFKDYISPQG